MFTWNIQYISQNKLTETLTRLHLDDRKGDILVRIHTAIHTPDEAVEMAAHIKRLIPGAMIFGTSTSAVIYRGKLLQNQCVVSITQMSRAGSIRTARFETFDGDVPVPVETLGRKVRDSVTGPDTKLLLTFLTGQYTDGHSFVESCNHIMPGVDMIGGLANTPDISLRKFADSGYVFDETGWSNRGIILAALGGADVACMTACATGVQPLGEEMTITGTFGNCILSLNGEDAAKRFREGTGNILSRKPEWTNLFPYVYADASQIPILVRYAGYEDLASAFPETDPANARFYEAEPEIDRHAPREMLFANHNVTPGKKLKRAFIYDKKIVADNRDLFRRIESFEKQETIFGYTCLARSMIYANCVKWELTPYEDTNMCGCITEGEIAHVDGKNVFANCSFVVSAVGEAPAMQRFNPYAFAATSELAADNGELMKFLLAIEQTYSEKAPGEMASSLQTFMEDCEQRMLYTEDGNMPNISALRMDMRLRGSDRVAMIHVPETAMMERVFGMNRVMLTRQQFIAGCKKAARENGYKIYEVNRWTLALGTASYLETLPDFTANMHKLRALLLETIEGAIQIMPTVCIIDDCDADNVMESYRIAVREMTRRNVQTIVYRPQTGQAAEEAFREKYRVINLLSYAAGNDKVIPYYQGIRDNRTGKLDHYESLMRLEDEEGKLHFPGEFLDIAMEFGTLYDAVSAAMVRRVLARFDGLEDVSVSINMGRRDLKNQELLAYIYSFLSTTAHPEHFIFELLEYEDIDDYEEMELMIGRLHALGAKVALDDFGSGFSNLQHVVNLDFDYLKIDGSIIRKCDTDSNCRAILALIAGWKRSREREIFVVAEFVENASIQKILNTYQIDYSQGYLFAKPERELAGEQA